MTGSELKKKSVSIFVILICWSTFDKYDDLLASKLAIHFSLSN